MAQRSKLCEVNNEQTISGTASGGAAEDVGSSSLFTPTIKRTIPFGIVLFIFLSVNSKLKSNNHFARLAYFLFFLFPDLA